MARGGMDGLAAAWQGYAPRGLTYAPRPGTITTRPSATSTPTALPAVPRAWVLAKAPVVIPIPGASRPESVTDSAAAADLVLSAAERPRLDRACSRLPPAGPAAAPRDSSGPGGGD